METLIISIIGLLISVFAIVFSTKASTKANSLVERNNQFVAGQTELQLSQTIDETKRHLMNVTFKIAELPTDADEKVKTMLNSLFLSAQESNVNAYESACGLYLDNKIDIHRFKKLYHIELRQLVENQSFKDFFNPESTSKYQAIWKVYRKWNILE